MKNRSKLPITDNLGYVTKDIEQSLVKLANASEYIYDYDNEQNLISNEYVE